LEIIVVLLIIGLIVTFGMLYVCLDEIEKLKRELDTKKYDFHDLLQMMKKSLIIQQRLCEDMAKLKTIK
jgi:predicted Holliday junction resolvase-like endonuclease